MTPVISPWVFYFLSVADSVKITTILLAVVAVIAAVVLGVVLGCEYDSYHPDEDKVKAYTKYLKLSLIVLAILLVLIILVPSGDTVTQMIIAKNVTYDTVTTVTDVVTTVYNDILGLFSNG